MNYVSRSILLVMFLELYSYKSRCCDFSVYLQANSNEKYFTSMQAE